MYSFCEAIQHFSETTMHVFASCVEGRLCFSKCVCVWTIWRDVKLLSFAGGPWALGWHGPTKTHPSFCANVPAIFESWWGVANPKTIMPFFNENHIRIFEFSTWTDEGDFSFIFLHSWRNLRLWWISCPLQFSANISEFLLASIDFIPFFKAATKEFSFQSTPNTLLFLSGVTGLFLTSDALHNRIRNDRSEQVCDSCWIRQGGMNPSGIPF